MQSSASFSSYKEAGKLNFSEVYWQKLKLTQTQQKGFM